MKPEERAEKMYRVGPSIKNWPREEYVAFLAAQIAEAEREIFTNEHVAGKISATLADIAYRKGFIAARAKAAGMVREKYFEDSCAEEWLAAEIEALEP